MFGRYAIAAILIATATPALADSSRCGTAPIAPANVDGNTASEDQMKNAIADFKTFQQQSDDYQSCLLADLRAQKLAAANDSKNPHPLDPSVEAGVNALIDANQKLKERLGAQLNAAILAYKGKHPGQ